MTTVSRPLSPQRIAAAQRAVARDIENNALTPELVKFRDPMERIKAWDIACGEWARTFDHERFLLMMRCVKLLRGMSRAKRHATVRYARRTFPKNCGYLIGYIREVKAGRTSPFRDLRMHGIYAMARDGKITFQNARSIVEAFKLPKVGKL